jgi:hypothetical protein
MKMEMKKDSFDELVRGVTTIIQPKAKAARRKARAETARAVSVNPLSTQVFGSGMPPFPKPNFFRDV